MKAPGKSGVLIPPMRRVLGGAVGAPSSPHFGKGNAATRIAPCRKRRTAKPTSLFELLMKQPKQNLLPPIIHHIERENVDVIITSTQGRSGLGRLLIGSRKSDPASRRLFNPDRAESKPPGL